MSVPGLQAFRCPLDSGGSREGTREARPPPPLFLDQTEARRAKKTCFGDHPPPYLSKSWMTASPLSQDLDHC